MPFNIPMGGFGGGAEFGSIYAKVGADLSDFDRGMAEAALTMKATAASMRSSGGVDRVGCGEGRPSRQDGVPGWREGPL
jgi:hypothetical protein